MRIYSRLTHTKQKALKPGFRLSLASAKIHSVSHTNNRLHLRSYIFSYCNTQRFIQKNIPTFTTDIANIGNLLFIVVAEFPNPASDILFENRMCFYGKIF